MSIEGSCRFSAKSVIINGSGSLESERRVTSASATARGISPNGVCTNPDPQVQRDFGSVCNALKECNDDCCSIFLRQMRPKCSVFIAVSLDGFIARKGGRIEWLSIVERPNEDYGYKRFFDSIDALVI